MALLLLGIALAASGCVRMNDPEGAQEYRSDVVGVARLEAPFGQTFVSRRPRLDAISIWLAVDAASARAESNLVVSLFYAPNEESPLRSLTIPIKSIRNDSRTYLTFKPLSDLPNQKYYLKIQTEGIPVSVLGRASDAYPNGQAYANGKPLDSDISFELAYDYDSGALANDLSAAFDWSWLLIPLVLLLIVPGWLLLDLAGLGQRFDAGGRAGLSLGLSLAVVPVLMTWTTLLGLSWTAGSVRLAATLLGLAALWRLYRRFRRGLLPRIDGISCALLAVFALCLAVRLIMVRDLATPPWVDSIHHSLIARLVYEQGGYPASYAPYLDIGSAGYHPGFHGLLAAFRWLTGLADPQAMLLFGQVLNALAVPAVYLFTLAFTQDRRAGLFAALIAGIATPMPAYYTSWGRYTQLAGLLILTPAITLLKTHIEHPSLIKQSARRMLLAAMACAGLFVTHYRVIAFLACLLIAVWLVNGTTLLLHRSPLRPLLAGVQAMALVAAAAILLTLPLWPATLSTFIVPKLTGWSGTIIPIFNDFSWSYLTSALGRQALALAGLGAFWALVQRKAFPSILLLWTSFMFMLANIGALGLPGSSFVNNISVEISLFIPIAALAGYVISQALAAWEAVLPRFRLVASVLALAIALWISIAGARQILPILNPVTILTRQADITAMTWLDKHIPAGETFLINPFSWGYGLYAGHDGGYWITPLTGRKTMPPPILYGFDNQTENIQRVNDLVGRALEVSADPQALHSFLKSAGVNYVFIGARGGALSPQRLLESGLFVRFYSKDGVWIFRVLP